MAKQENPSTHDETDSVESGKTACQPSPSVTRESLELNLSEGQRHTILKYAELPVHLSERLAAKGTEAKGTQFTLDELDELLDHVAQSGYRAKGNEKQKVLRIVEKVSKLLGSTIDPDEMSKRRLPKKTDTAPGSEESCTGHPHRARKDDVASRNRNVPYKRLDCGWRRHRRL